MARPWEITGDDIRRWAQEDRASLVLPDLVRRLLLATSPVGTVDMRADGGTRLGGLDGVVQSFRATAFCPRGQSVWELSVEEDVGSKLGDDFKKRTDTPAAGALPAASTYVAVTARRYAKKQSWAAERRARGAWIDVRVMDADDLAAWLSQAPAVSRWFAEEIGKPGYDAIDLERYLARWQARTSPPLPVEIVLAGRERERAAEVVRQWVRSGRPQPLMVKGDTKEEAVLFTAAALARAPGAEGEVWRSRAVVVESEQTLRWACRVATTEPLIVLPAFEGMEAKLVEAGAYVLVPLDASAKGGGLSGPLTLGPVPYRRIAEILAERGIPPEEAEQRAEESGGKLSSLQRLFGYVALPAWARALDPVPLAAMLLVGAWQPENEADREVLRALGAEPREVEMLCERLRIIPDAATEREQERWGRAVWKWAAEGDAWKALAGSLPAESLRRFAEVAAATLGKEDPRFTLRPDERFAAQIHGKVLEESEAMRGGLTRALVRLALSDEDLRVLHGPRKGSGIADRVVRRVLAPGWKLWASVGDLLPLLAEAAPEVFLDRLEESLGAGDEGAAHLLAEEGQGGSPHTGLLWALETLGWSEAYFARVAEALARLAEVDEKLPAEQRRLANRPAASLHKLIHWGFAQTRAPAEARRALLRRMVSWPNGYEFVIGQVNGVGKPGMMVPAHETKVRAWVLPEAEIQQRANVEALKNVEALVNVALEYAGDDGTRWVLLLDAGHGLPELLVERIFDRLEQTGVAVGGRDAIWAALRRWLHQSAPEDPTQRVPSWRDHARRLYDDKRFLPLDLATRFAWLFDPIVELPDHAESCFDEDDKPLKDARTAAIVAIWQAPERREVLRRFAQETHGRSWLLGESLAWATLTPEVLTELLGDPAGNLTVLAAYCSKRIRIQTDPGAARGVVRELAREVLGRLVPDRGGDAAASVAKRLPTSNELWDVVDELGEDVRARYWAEVPYVVSRETVHDVDLSRAVRELLRYGNWRAALDAVDIGRDEGEDAIAVLEVISHNEDIAQQALGEGLALHRMAAVMKRVEGQPGVDATLLEGLGARIALASGDPRADQRHLSAVLERSFLYFARMLYRRDGDPPQAEGSPSAAYRVLYAWEGYPGAGLPAGQREEHLYAWAKSMLDTLAAEGRTTATIEVANVLARAPAGADGHWPCLAARRLVDAGAYPNLADAMDTAKRNLRGMYGKSIGEGGKQERAIADGFGASAKALRAEWPRTAAMLDALAYSYGREAEQEDERAQAELRQMGAEPEDFAPPAPAASQAGPPSEPATTREIVRLESIDLTNIAAISDLNLPLSAPPPDKGQLVVLLGENGAGKTSTLRALTVALASHPAATAGLAAMPAPLIKDGASSASCRVRWNARESAAELSRTESGQVLTQPDAAQTDAASRARPLVFAYGCRRGSALGGTDSADLNAQFSDIATLFSEWASVYPAIDWLRRRERLSKDPSRDGSAHASYRAIVAAICAMLPEVEDIVWRDDNFWARATKLGGEVRLAALSDGYLTTIGWVIDLIARWLHHAEKHDPKPGANFLQEMTGLVLVDEPDLHLHPRWQMRLLKDIRALFPLMTFVVTTHNPATVVGAKADEIWILRNEAGRIVAEQRTQPPKLLSGSEIYSAYFGLPYMAPQLAEKIQRYGFLAGAHVRTEEEETEVNDLLRELRDEGVDPGWEPVPRRPPPRRVKRKAAGA